MFKFDWSKSFKAILGMFQIFDRFVNIFKNFNPDLKKKKTKLRKGLFRLVTVSAQAG